MNALVGAGWNTSGLLSPTPQERVEAAEQAQSYAKANLLGRLPKALAAQLKQAEGAADASSNPQQLDQDAFLQLLLNQVQNQDPLEPVSNSDMMSQLAQLSSLEQMQNLSNEFSRLTGVMDRLNFVSASSLIGRNVSGTDEAGNLIEGEVDGVSFQDNKARLRIGEQWLPLDRITQMQ